MKKIFLFLLIASYSIAASADIKYVDAKVERIETCKSGNTIYIFLKEITGTSPSSGNGCSNDAVYPYVKLNSENGVITELEKIMFSSALAAHASEKSLRIRFEDSNNVLISIAID